MPQAGFYRHLLRMNDGPRYNVRMAKKLPLERIIQHKALVHENYVAS